MKRAFVLVATFYSLAGLTLPRSAMGAEAVYSTSSSCSETNCSATCGSSEASFFVSAPYAELAHIKANYEGTEGDFPAFVSHLPQPVCVVGVELRLKLGSCNTNNNVHFYIDSVRKAWTAQVTSNTANTIVLGKVPTSGTPENFAPTWGKTIRVLSTCQPNNRDQVLSLGGIRITYRH